MSYPNMPANGQFSGRPAPQPTDGPRVGQPSPSYPLAVRDSGLGTAWLLLMRTLPYALARFAVLLAATAIGMAWLVVAFGGAWWIGDRVSTMFGFAWLVPWLLAGGWMWGTVIRYSLHLIACGHVAVLTQLITRGSVGSGDESQFAFGRRVVISRFGEVTALFGVNVMIAGVLAAVHGTLDWLGEMLPIPGVQGIASLLNLILKAATRYLDKVVLSYSLAQGETDAWQSARDGIIYYCQNARTILKTSIWIVVMEAILSALLFLAVCGLGAVLAASLPPDWREVGSSAILIFSVLLAVVARAAFVKPLFLICLMIRFHTVIEQQPLSQDWVDKLDHLFQRVRRGAAPASATI